MSKERLNCAGQGCEERDECRRYRIRLARIVSEAHRIVGVPYDEKVFDWASFDIERIWFGECKSLIQYRES